MLSLSKLAAASTIALAFASAGTAYAANPNLPEPSEPELPRLYWVGA